MNRLRIPRLVIALAALLATSVALAGCGGSDEADPGEAISGATLQGIESAQVELSLKASAKGRGGGDIDVSVSGPFQGQGSGEIPLLDMTATAGGELGGEAVDFEGGVTLLPNSAYVNLEGDLYEVDPTTFSFVESALEQAQRESGPKAGASACQEALGDLKPGEFVEGAEAEGGVDVGGESTTEVSGDLDVAAAIDQILEIARDPACSAQVGAAGGLPSEAEIEKAVKEIEGAVKSASAEVYVGEDGIVRRVALDATVAPEKGRTGVQTVTIDLDLQLTEVNEEVEISAPEGKARPITALFQKLGIDPLEALGLLQGEGDLGSLLEELGGSLPGAGSLAPGK